MTSVQFFCNGDMCLGWFCSSVLCLCPSEWDYQEMGWSGQSVWKVQSEQNRTEWCRKASGGSWRVRLLIQGVKGLVCCTVLVHLDGEVEPGLWLCVRGSAHCHSCQGHRDSTVKASSELDHNSLGVGVSRVLNEVSELVCKGDCNLAECRRSRTWY